MVVKNVVVDGESILLTFFGCPLSGIDVVVIPLKSGIRDPRILPKKS